MFVLAIINLQTSLPQSGRKGRMKRKYLRNTHRHTHPQTHTQKKKKKMKQLHFEQIPYPFLLNEKKKLIMLESDIVTDETSESQRPYVYNHRQLST